MKPSKKIISNRIKSEKPKPKIILSKLVTKYPEIGPIGAFIILFTIFSLVEENFSSLLNWGGIIALVSEYGIVILGITFLMISGEFDISIGSAIALTAVVFARLANIENFPHLLAFIIAVLVGATIGMINGIITLKIKIPSFIATLGTMMLWRGFVLGAAGGQAYTRYIGEETLFFKILNVNFYGQFRVSFFWLILIFVILYFVLYKTKYGNYVFAAGGNKEAARSMGINVDRVKLINFIIVGILTGIAGCISFTRFKTVDPLMGKGLELNAIAAAVIGGTALYGGKGTLLGSIFGLTIISMIGTFLVMLGVGAFWFQSIVGVILIFAVFLNSKLRGLEIL